MNIVESAFYRGLQEGGLSVIKPRCSYSTVTIIVVFLDLGREISALGQIRSTPIAASCNLLRISPILPPSRVPNYYRLQSFRITKPPNGTVLFDSFDLTQLTQENQIDYI